MKKSDRKKLYSLLEEWTKCIIIARHGYKFPDFAQYFADALQKEDEIRQLLYGESNLIVLGQRWKLPIDPPKHKKKKKKKPAKKLKPKMKRKTLL